MFNTRTCTIGLLIAAACGGGDPTMTSDSGATGTATTGAATSSGGTSGPTTSAGTTASATTDLPTGGSGGGTDSDSGGSSTGPSGSGTGGEGSGLACTKWYAALVDSYRPACECQVSMGMYRDVDQCLAETLPPSDCACQVFAESPETAAMLECYQGVAEDKSTCLAELGMCPKGLPLKTCDELEAAALLTCGAPSGDVCDALAMMCDDLPPLLCLP